MSLTAAGEFDLIDAHLSGLGARRSDVVLGVGDDAAVMTVPEGARLATVCAGTGAQGADDAGEAARTCAASAFDALGEAGATPAWITLALTLERGDEDWVAQFAAALDLICRARGVSVAGGDTTSGRRAATVFATGLVSPDR